MPLIEKIGFGTGDMALNVVISSMMLIITYFYTDIFGLKPMDLAALFVTVKVVGAISDLIMGQITDRFSFKSGRYRPWLLLLAVPYGITIYFTFMTPDWDYDAKLLWAYSTYILVTLITSGVGVSYISLPGVITTNPQERLSANGYRLFFAKIGALLVTSGVPLLAEKWGDVNPAVGYQSAMAVMALIGVLMFAFCALTVKEVVRHPNQQQNIFEQLAVLMRNDQWLVLAGVCITGTVGYVLRGSVAMYYAIYYLGMGKAEAGTFMSVGVFAAIAAMVASTWITKTYCKVKLFRYSQVLVAVISVAMYFMVQPGEVMLAMVFYFLLSFVVDLHAPVFWSAIPETVDYGQVRTGERVAGFAFGGISVCQKAGMAIGGALVGILFTYYGYVANQVQTPEATQGIALMVTVIPGFFHFLMGGLMFLYRINDPYYETVKTEMRTLGYATH
jgi:GPH family glycoside/pentoside/hexuronide:cation symporter